MSEARDVLLAAMHDWNPDLHPRGHDGKFIEVLGWVNVKGIGGDEHSGGKRGQVQSIIPDKSNPGNPKIRVDFGKGDVKDVRPDQVSQAMETKARLDVKPSVDAKPSLPPPPPTAKAPPTPPPPSKFDPNADHLEQFKWGNPGPDGGKEAIKHLSDSELDQVISDRERQSKDPSDTRWFTRNQEVMDLQIEKTRRTKFGGTNEGDPTKQIPAPPQADKQPRGLLARHRVAKHKKEVAERRKKRIAETDQFFREGDQRKRAADEAAAQQEYIDFAKQTGLEIASNPDMTLSELEMKRRKFKNAKDPKVLAAFEKGVTEAKNKTLGRNSKSGKVDLKP
jgi:hypothetical protein